MHKCYSVNSEYVLYRSYTHEPVQYTKTEYGKLADKKVTQGRNQPAFRNKEVSIYYNSVTKVC